MVVSKLRNAKFSVLIWRDKVLSGDLRRVEDRCGPVAGAHRYGVARIGEVVWGQVL